MKKKDLRNQMTPPKFLAIGFASITLIGTFLLKLPIATADGTSTPIVDALHSGFRHQCNGFNRCGYRYPLVHIWTNCHAHARSAWRIGLYDLSHLDCIDVQPQNLASGAHDPSGSNGTIPNSRDCRPHPKSARLYADHRRGRRIIADAQVLCHHAAFRCGLLRHIPEYFHFQQCRL